MSIALDSSSNNRGIGAGGLTSGGGSWGLAFERRVGDPVKELELELELEEEVNECSSSFSTSSSIGRNSDLSSDGEDCGENEAESSYKGPLEMMEALEEVLPMRRGISSFYNGKSKSFTSLAEASSSSSIKDIGKAENAYTRKRRNLVAFNSLWDKNRNFPLRSNGSGISKRSLISSRSTLALAVAMSSSDSISNSSEDSSSRSRSPPPLPPLPPPPPPPSRNLSAWRSISLVDLQHCATAATTNTTTHQLATKPIIPN